MFLTLIPSTLRNFSIAVSKWKTSVYLFNFVHAILPLWEIYHCGHKIRLLIWYFSYFTLNCSYSGCYTWEVDFVIMHWKAATNKLVHNSHFSIGLSHGTKTRLYQCQYNLWQKFLLLFGRRQFLSYIFLAMCVIFDSLQFFTPVTY